MALFEITVNGESRFRGEKVKAITLVSDAVRRRDVERVTLHVGTGGAGEREIHSLAANLVPGDEITIRLLEDEEAIEDGLADLPDTDGCKFCGSPFYAVESLVSVRDQAICDACIASLSRVVLTGAPLPVGASICEVVGEAGCVFCCKAPPDVPALLVRNDAAICPECLRACADLRQADSDLASD